MRAKSDLYFLATVILGYNKLSPNLHGHFASWMKKTQDWQYRLMLLPRGHFKSTIATISDTVQIVMPDDLGNAPFPRNLGTNARVLIAHESGDEAARFLAAIGSHYRRNPYMLMLFPECVPGKSQIDNASQLELPRTSIWTEATVESMGVKTRGQGRHYDYIKPDDIYGVEARDSDAAHKQVINWLNNLQSFLLSPATGKIDFPGTRYKHDDVYNHIMGVYGDQLVKYIRPVLEWDEKAGMKMPIFPEQFTLKSLEILKKDPLVWDSQYLNDPSSGESEFPREWERFYERAGDWGSNDRSIVYFTGDKAHKKSWLSLDRLIFVDPAVNGPSGIVVTGTNEDQNPKVFILETDQKSYKPPELVEKLFQLNRKWQPRAIVIEEVLFSELFRHWITREQGARREYFRIIPARTRQKRKEDRVRGLATWLSNGQIWFHESQDDILGQKRKFPGAKDYHILDALAYGPEYWRASSGDEQEEKIESALEYLKRTRNPVTGYSR